ncbi:MULTISPECIES: L,D-transpeptidase family protein [unclassified Devosia]|uniref:L,D-transpeptidase family protein n=1 Tax=unclassified Devosia TaxID=196773 RepID=UPI000A4AA2CD|nr:MULTISPECIES: L,D-transpeptidase family protein [unclassified Devosia]MBN9360760.1 L,D-transpeptidase family protein [Devosia sp.]
MHISRRKLLASAALSLVGVTVSRAQESDAGWDLFGSKPKMRKADIDGNTATAKSLVDTVEPILSAQTSVNLQLAIENYEAFVAANGNWDPPPREAFGLQLGKSGRAAALLKRRLMINGDMPLEKRANDEFDAALDAGVRLFQARHGLNINGHVDEATFYAMSVPADYRLNQLRLNAQRVDFWASSLSDRYVVVNIPAATIEAVEASQVVQRHTAVVGKVDRSTPILNSKIHQVKFNPFWTVPKSIIRKDLIRYMNEDPEYLAKFRIRIFDGKGNELSPTAIDWSTEDAVNYTFRQDPGAENSLGRCKVDFYNKYDVYMHDTPLKGLFGENARFLSSGCVRAENIDTLVAWLLRDNGGWDLAGVQTAFEGGLREDIKLKVQVPIHTTYITAWANSQGTVSFRDDVYEFDAAGKVSFPEAA